MAVKRGKHSEPVQVQVQLLTNLCGKYLLRMPLMFFIWGALLLFVELFFYFRLNVDPGASCSMCLGICLVVGPLFLHCLHKMAWVAEVVMADAESRSTHQGDFFTAKDIRASFVAYKTGKTNKGVENVLALDRDEFLQEFAGGSLTSVQLAFAGQVFDRHVAVELEKLHGGVGRPEAIFSGDRIDVAVGEEEERFTGIVAAGEDKNLSSAAAAAVPAVS